MHLAMPMLREAWKEGMTEAEARQLVAKCLEVLKKATELLAAALLDRRHGRRWRRSL